MARTECSSPIEMDHRREFDNSYVRSCIHVPLNFIFGAGDTTVEGIGWPVITPSLRMSKNHHRTNSNAVYHTLYLIQDHDNM